LLQHVLDNDLELDNIRFRDELEHRYLEFKNDYKRVIITVTIPKED
jgi:hypothetical protein